MNVAKVILWNYWEQNKSKDLVATFMLIGYLKSGGMRVEVVRDSDLAEAKEKFEKIISEHIYSVQKTLTSIELLAGSGEGDSRFSAIKCIENSLLSDQELQKMRWGEASTSVNVDDKKQNTASEKKNAVVEKKNIFDRKKNSSAGEKDTVGLAEKKIAPVASKKEEENCMDIDEESSKTKRKTEEKPTKKVSPSEKPKVEKKGSNAKKPVQSTKTGFGNLFGKAMNQQKIQNNSSAGLKKADTEKAAKKSPEEKSVPTKNVESEKSENINKKEPPPNLSEKNKKEKEESEILANDPPKSPGKKEKNVLPTIAKKQSTGKKKQKPIRGTKRDRSGEDSGSEKKKRKRIVVASDSSEDSAGPSDEEDMFASPPDDQTPKTREKSPSPPLLKREGNKRKVRKMVDSTYIDDRGYLITKKSYVYETCSEEDEPVVEEPKKKPQPEVPEETKTNVKKKQTTLTNFFKKA